MAAITAVILWLIILHCGTSEAQSLFNKTEVPYKKSGICKRMLCNSLEKLKLLEDCVVVLGDLQVMVMEKAVKKDFDKFTFSKLREVTGFVILYRVKGLESVGQLFPNLVRIRGDKVFNDFGLIVYDMEDLKEIGLYNLLKIDRGGVIIWSVPQACFITTVNWKAIVPMARRVFEYSEDAMHCASACRCTNDLDTNKCWNTKRCQRFYEGPEAENCHEQCFGCRITSPNQCLLCRHYTYKHECVSACPNDTLLLPVNKYCLSEQECKDLGGWEWKKTCILECPLDFAKHTFANGSVTCKPCRNCDEICKSLLIQSTSTIEAAKRCVYINGSLRIHIKSIPGAIEELQAFMGRIQNVTDYVEIHGSVIITSLDFLSSLRYIGGRNLYANKYSLVVHDMVNLQTLFTTNVTNNLEIGNGTMNFYRNPVLCINEIEKLLPKFREKPNDIDVPKNTNGYSGGCAHASVPLNVTIINETSVAVTFQLLEEPDVHYSLLYIRVPLGSKTDFVPETCSESEWHAINVAVEPGKHGSVNLTDLHPASKYALCVEIYEPKRNYVARSTIYNFSTHVGKPEPSFISELVAKNDEVVVIRWVDHLVYQPYIVRYELDVSLIEIYPRDVTTRNFCNDNFEEIDDDRHAVVYRPPVNYERGCESMCGVLSDSTKGALVENYFDICYDLPDFGCNVEESPPPGNSSFGKYVRTLSLNISGSKSDFQVGELAPYRDYRFRLRACTRELCSRSTKGVVRTLRSEYADIPTLTYASANEFGYISVAWRPPELTNGPILAYLIEVIPTMKVNEIAHLLPRSWCVPSSQLSIVIKYFVDKKYVIRVCSRTLASKSACGEYKSVIVSSVYVKNWTWFACTFGIVLFSASIVVGRLRRTRRQVDDMIPLVEYVYNDSQSPTLTPEDMPSCSSAID
ncbi:insulin-like growth factor 1 receptor [Amyelois transitella]|uniref:insulin-like growth factor 1 receptor n=1 Tax=Amyelois transitella TaxID=680683 RepID=UPI00299012E9|nr:insulin-like growth factor 1 receptor [Amyelois transitella]